jgi:hypothetical protein
MRCSKELFQLAGLGIHLSDRELSDLVTHLKTFYWREDIRQLFKANDSCILTCEFDELPFTIENFPSFKGMSDKTSTFASEPGDAQDLVASADQDRN